MCYAMSLLKMAKRFISNFLRQQLTRSCSSMSIQSNGLYRRSKSLSKFTSFISLI